MPIVENLGKDAGEWVASAFNVLEWSFWVESLTTVEENQGQVSMRWLVGGEKIS